MKWKIIYISTCYNSKYGAGVSADPKNISNPKYAKTYSTERAANKFARWYNASHLNHSWMAFVIEAD